VDAGSPGIGSEAGPTGQSPSRVRKAGANSGSARRCAPHGPRGRGPRRGRPVVICSRFVPWGFRMQGLIGASCTIFVVTFSDQPSPDTFAQPFEHMVSRLGSSGVSVGDTTADRGVERGEPLGRTGRHSLFLFRRHFSLLSHPPTLSHAKPRRRKGSAQDGDAAPSCLRGLCANPKKAPHFCGALLSVQGARPMPAVPEGTFERRGLLPLHRQNWRSPSPSCDGEE
jgi:hypothetical protein